MTGHHSVIRREWVFDGYWLDKVKNGAKGIATGPASMKVEEEALLLADPSEITLVPGEEIIFYYQPMSIERGRARITAPSAHAATLDMNPHTTPAGFTGHVVSNTTMSPSYTCPLPVIYWHNSNNPSWAVKLAQQSLNYWHNTSSTGFRTWVHEYSNGNPFLLAVDGQFGVLTQQAVFDFQDYYGLDPDGIVGPRTWHALGHC